MSPSAGELGFDATRPFDVTTVDTTFAAPDGEALGCTIYQPAGGGSPTTGRIGIIDLHGGAWRHFDRSVDAHYDRALAACGAVVVAVDFRQAPNHRWPSSAADANAAVRWVKANATELGVNAECVGLLGGSSGGHLALVTAVAPHRADLVTTEPLPWNLVAMPGPTTVDATVDATVGFAIALWPVAAPDWRYRYLAEVLADPGFSTAEPMFFPERLRSAQEQFFVDEDTMASASVFTMLDQRITDEGTALESLDPLPPLFVAHPELDCNVTVEMSEALASAWQGSGGDVHLTVFPGVGHSFANFPTPEAEPCIDAMIAFVDRVTRTIVS